jgi:abhydrolase domain-containing protein 6
VRGYFLSVSRFFGYCLFALYEFLFRRLARLSEKAIQLDNHKIFYLEGGKGEPVLLLHGFGGDKSNWMIFSKYLTSAYRVIALDLPGFGQSSRIWSEKYDIPSQISRVHQFVEQVGLRRFHIAGNSMGGLIAGVYAATYPEEILTLGLFDPGGVIDREPSELARQLERGNNPLIVKTPAEYFQLVKFVSSNTLYIPYVVQVYLGDVAAKHKDFNQKAFTEAKPGDQLETRMADIRAKTLILWGDSDRVFPASNARVLNEGIAGSKLLIFEECGHIPMIEKPRRTANHYLDFIK